MALNYVIRTKYGLTLALPLPYVSHDVGTEAVKKIAAFLPFRPCIALFCFVPVGVGVGFGEREVAVCMLRCHCARRRHLLLSPAA
jgi:hypothetical protein